MPGNKSGSRKDARRAWKFSPEELIFFMAAGLRPVKNIGYALEAFALFKKKHPQSRLLLAGPCLDANESERVLAAGERIDGFSYCGELPHARVLELMQAADIFLNTSLQEGMPGAVMEAMAAGVAVIATDVAGNRALIENMRTGILVPPRDTELLREACERLAASPDLRQQLGGACPAGHAHALRLRSRTAGARGTLHPRFRPLARLVQVPRCHISSKIVFMVSAIAALTTERPAAPLIGFHEKNNRVIMHHE